MALLDDERLERSAVVANCRMNRERTLTGSNGYARELGFDPLGFLADRLDKGRRVAWLDLCCGSGLALLEAHRVAAERGWARRLSIVGVDLIDGFTHVRDASPSLQFVAASVRTWEPDRPFDLITCVHGLHYVGDKLGLIERMVGWLALKGTFALNFAATSVHVVGRRDGPRLLAADFRDALIHYDPQRRFLTGSGPRRVRLPYRYLGADDSVGPNYTGQPAVASHYERVAVEPT